MPNNKQFCTVKVYYRVVADQPIPVLSIGICLITINDTKSSRLFFRLSSIGCFTKVTDC